MYYLLKVLISAVIIATASEIAKRNSVIAALITSLPLTSLLVFIWMKLWCITGSDRRAVDSNSRLCGCIVDSVYRAVGINTDSVPILAESVPFVRHRFYSLSCLHVATQEIWCS